MTPWLLLVAVLYSIYWCFMLCELMLRRDITPIERLTWVIVLIFVPVVGLLLYIFGSQLPAEPRHDNTAPGDPADRVITADTRGTPWEHDPNHHHAR